MPNSKGERSNTRNKLRNEPRERGSSPPSHAVREFDEGEKVHIKIDPSVPDGRPTPRFHGLTGEVVGKQGRAFKVRITDGDKPKTLVIRPSHLVPQEE